MTTTIKGTEHTKLRGREKLARIPVKIAPTTHALAKPEWIRIKLNHNSQVNRIKNQLRTHHLHTVCEEASCPNLNECFSKGTATFMILGDKCTRRCSFCDVAHGRPEPPDAKEPENLATTIKAMGLKYVVITSVNRDDLRDGGAQHFINCMKRIKEYSPTIRIEILVPDFRGRVEKALSCFEHGLPDVFNHNLETIPTLYKQARPGADYEGSLSLLQVFKQKYPHVLTKSGIMLGLGETYEQVKSVLQDMRAYNIDMVTLGQYLQPSRYHMPVARYVTPDEFNQLAHFAREIGFKQVASGPLVRSSYHADQQWAGEGNLL